MGTPGDAAARALVGRQVHHGVKGHESRGREGRRLKKAGLEVPNTNGA